MRESKRELPLFSIYDHTGIVEHLEKRAAQGWMLESMGPLGWTYRRRKPGTIHFAVTYFPKASIYDPGPSAEQQSFQDYFSAAGWELAASAAQMQVFYSTAESPLPIETDAAMQVENIHRAMKRNFLPAQCGLLAVALLQLGLILWRVFSDPIDVFSNTSNLFTCFCSLFLLVMSVSELVTYGRWHQKASAAAAESGTFTPTRSRRRFQVFMLAVILLWMAAWLLGSLRGSRLQLLSALWGILYGVVLVGGINLLTWWMKRRKISARINRTVTLVSAVAVSFLSMGFMIFAVFRLSDSGWLRSQGPVETYTAHGMTWEIYHDDLPLTIEDLLETDYGSYSYQAERNSTFLLSQIDATQRPRVGDKDIPDLEYLLIKTPFSALYNLCLRQRIDWMARWNEEVPEEHWDEYRPVKIPAWQAEQVYQMYSSGEPRNQYLVCWPGRFAEIDFGWPPTEGQIALAAERMLQA